MPLFLEPGKKLAIWLESDEPTLLENRPVFFVKSLSMRQQESFGEEIDEALKHDTTKAIFEANCSLLSSKLTGWQNMGSHFYGMSDLQDFLAFSEVRELLRKVMSNQHLAYDEKKS